MGDVRQLDELLIEGYGRAYRTEVAPDPNDGLGAAWDDARRRFGDSLEGLVAWSGSAAVVLLVALVVGVLGRLAWVRGRRLLV